LVQLLDIPLGFKLEVLTWPGDEVNSHALPVEELRALDLLDVLDHVVIDHLLFAIKKVKMYKIYVGDTDTNEKLEPPGFC
jgi:hypothetical protein